jgi:hypothetical protein
MCVQFDLTLADIYTALRWYFDHRDEIDHNCAKSVDFAEVLRQRTPSALEKKLN